LVPDGQSRQGHPREEQLRCHLPLCGQPRPRLGGDHHRLRNGTPFSIGGQSAATVHEFHQADAGYVTIVDKGVSGGKRKWEIKFTNFNNPGPPPSGAKNFKDTMPAGLYTFAVYAKSAGGLCNQTLFNALINTSSKAAAVGPCQEDLFGAAPLPPAVARQAG
jgi:hypothetical protein